MRRIMYWWHILHAKQSDMLVKVYNVQKVSHVQGDWIRLLEKDKKMFKINLSDEEVSGMSRYKMKNFVKKRGQELTLNYIEGLKKKHSKSEHFEKSTLKTAQYLTDNSFTKSQRELLFKLRSKTVQVKANFRNRNILDMVCEICQLFTCTQEHVLQCPVLTQQCTIVNTANLKHSFIYGNVEQQLLYTQIYIQFWEARQSILELQKQN